MKRSFQLKPLFDSGYTGPIDYEVRDPHITTEGDLAFLHSLNHVKGTLVSGQNTDLWLRWTACWRRIAGVWVVVHGHVSVPADLEHGRAGPESPAVVTEFT